MSRCNFWLGVAYLEVRHWSGCADTLSAYVLLAWCVVSALGPLLVSLSCKHWFGVSSSYHSQGYVQAPMLEPFQVISLFSLVVV